MDIKDRKTALDDDSILYQKRDAESNKKDVQDLNHKGKLQYFVDYYLMKVVIVAVALLVVGYMGYNMIFHQEVTTLTIAAVGNVYLEDPEALGQDLRSLYALTDPDEHIYVHQYLLDDYNQQMAFTTHVAAREVDLMIMDLEQYERHAQQGMFADLSQILPADLYEELKDQMLSEPYYQYDVQGNVESVSDPYPSAIEISHNPFLSGYCTSDRNFYIGVCIGSQRTDNAVKFLDYLFHPEHYERSEA